MLTVGKDDLRNRISPRLWDFYTESAKIYSDPADKPEGIVAWRKNYLTKDYCQSTNAYTCQRPAASISGSEGTGDAKRG